MEMSKSLKIPLAFSHKSENVFLSFFPFDNKQTYPILVDVNISAETLGKFPDKLQ